MACHHPPGLIAVFCRPLFIEPDKKFPKAVALDAAFPCEEVAAPNNASRMNPSIEPSMIKANSASTSPSNTP